MWEIDLITFIYKFILTLTLFYCYTNVIGNHQVENQFNYVLAEINFNLVHKFSRNLDVDYH